MRVIKVSTLKKSMERYPLASQSLLAWIQEAKHATWTNPNELKAQYVNASVLTGKRIVFNIHGNAYRLIVDVDFKFQLIFIIWFGAHHEYDKIDAKNIKHIKTDSDD